MQAIEAFPGEFTTLEHVHIKQRTWFFLMRHAPFRANWKSPESDYDLAASCVHVGMSELQTKTLVRIWHHKHKLPINEVHMDDMVHRAYLKHGRSQDIYAANEYYAEVRRVQRDKAARNHQKMRVAYSLTNDGPATAQELSKRLAISVTTVYNNLAILKKDGKGEASSGVNRIVESFRWDSGDIWADLPAMYDHGQVINVIKANGHYMEAWDYTRDAIKGVRIASGDLNAAKVSEWVINASGDVVAHGTGIPFFQREGKPSKASSGESEDIDYFARLSD